MNNRLYRIVQFRVRINNKFMKQSVQLPVGNKSVRHIIQRPCQQQVVKQVVQGPHLQWNYKQTFRRHIDNRIRDCPRLKSSSKQRNLRLKAVFIKLGSKIILKRKPIFIFLRDWERSETKLAEEYFWAITQAVRGHAAAGRFTVYHTFDFSWTTWCMHINFTEYKVVQI